MSNEFRHKFDIFSQSFCKGFSLCDAALHKPYKITCCTLAADSRTRLAQLGLVTNAVVQVTGKAPFGDPIIIFVQGYSLCMRKDTAKHFFIEEL